MLRKISSVQDPRIDFFRDLKGQHPRLTASGKILIEGKDQLKRALKRGVEIYTLFCDDEFCSSADLTQFKEVLTAPLEIMEQIVGYRLHRGILALAARPKNIELKELEFPAFALEGITDPENVGTIARNAAAFGIRSIIFDSESSDPLSRRAIRVSMGGVFDLNIAPVNSLEKLFEHSLNVIAIEKGGTPINEFSFPTNGVFILGNEKRGVSKDLLLKVAAVVSIPMEDSLLSSINVGSASAVIGAEIFRRKVNC